MLCLAESTETRLARVPDDYIEQLKSEIVTLQAMLGPLESGKMHIGERRVNEPWQDRTQAQIDWLKRNIAMYQAMVDSKDA